MPVLTFWVLAAALAVPSAPGAQSPRRIDVNCQFEHGLERALARAKTLGKVDINLHGVCEGNFVIATDGITLRGATSDSGLAAPSGSSTNLPVLEVVDAQAVLAGLVVQGGVTGVLARGWDAEVLLFGVDVHGQAGEGVVAIRGASVKLFDGTVRDGTIGITADSSGEISLQGVVVSDQRIGVVVRGGSFATLTNATIENNREAGLTADTRSDVTIFGGAFRENGQVHVHAGEWSEINLLSGVTLGSDHDLTPYSMGVIRDARIGSYSTPVIFGDVSALDGGSIQFGETVLNGGLFVQQFANAYVRDATITGSIYCADGSEAICSGVTTGGVIGCPSATCGAPTPAPSAGASAARKFPVIEVPRFDLPRRARSSM
jgi:hypothetical protein